MDIDQLKTFVKIVELKSYSKAAMSLHISQPTVSTRIRALEEELKQKLLHRQSKIIQLTPAGEYFFEHAQKIIAASDEATKTLLEFSSYSEFSIGVTPLCARYLLSDIIPRLQQHYGDIPLNIRTVGQPYQLIEMFSKGIIDVVLLSAYNIAKANHVELLWKEPTVLVSSPGRAIVGNVKSHDLNRYPLALLSPEKDVYHYSHQLIELCKEEQIELKPQMVIDNLELAKQLVKQGSIITFLPYLCVEEEIQSGQMVEIPCNLSKDLSSSIYFFYRASPHKELFSLFYSLLKENACRRESILNETFTD